MTSVDSGYVQYLAYLQSQAAQTGANQMLQQSISDGASCEHFGSIKDAVSEESRRLGDLIHSGDITKLQEFCSLGKEVSGNGLNTVNNVNRVGVELQTSIERNGIATRETVERNGISGRDSTERNGISSRDAVERNGIATRLSVTNAEGNVKDAVTNGEGRLTGNIHTTSSSTKDAVVQSTQWVRDSVSAAHQNIKDNINLNSADIKDNVTGGHKWLHENIINGDANLKDTINLQGADIKDSIWQNALEIRNAAERANVSIERTAGETRSEIGRGQAQVTSAINMSAFEGRMGMKDLGMQIADKAACVKETIFGSSSDIKDKLTYGFANNKDISNEKFSEVKDNLSWSKYEALKNKEALAFQLSKTQHDIEKDLAGNFRHTNEKMSMFEHNMDKTLCKVEHDINSNIDGNFRFTNDKLYDAKYEALKNKEAISSQISNNQHLTTFELNKAAGELSKQMTCGFSSVAQQLNDAKYEALKNKEKLYSQAATNFAASQMDAYKNKCDLAMQMSEFKFEAAKGKDALSRQLEECCCEIKMQQAEDTCAVKQKISETSCEGKELARQIDTTRIRDKLEATSTENTFLKYAGAFGDDDCYGGFGRRRRSSERNVVNDNYIYIDESTRGRKRGRRGHDGFSSDDESFDTRSRSNGSR